MNEAIRGYAAGAAGLSLRAGKARSLVGELRALIDFLDRADELQWALTDTSIPIVSRRAIVEELLSGKLDGLAVRLVSFVVGADRPTEAVANLRWVTNFLDTMPEVPATSGSVATSVAEGSGGAGMSAALALPDELIGPSVGRHGTRERSGGFAAAEFGAVGDQGRISEIEDELFRFARIVEGNGELRRALVDRNVPSIERARFVADLLSGKADQVTVDLVAYTIRSGNVGNLVALIDWLVELAAIERNGRVGEARVAVALSPEEHDRISAALRRVTGHDVELRVVVDHSVIGGAQVTVGEMVIDGTVRRALQEARQALLSEPIGS